MDAGNVTGKHLFSDRIKPGDVAWNHIVAEVMPEHSLGYDVPDLKPGERYRGGWWRPVIKPGLQAHPDVEPPSTGQSDLTYLR